LCIHHVAEPPPHSVHTTIPSALKEQRSNAKTAITEATYGSEKEKQLQRIKRDYSKRTRREKNNVRAKKLRTFLDF
jgi:hypothetical protein